MERMGSMTQGVRFLCYVFEDRALQTENKVADFRRMQQTLDSGID